MATGFLLATCCSDPGIIPRREAGDSVGFFWVLRNWFLGRLSSERCTLCYIISYYVMLYNFISYHIISYYTYFIITYFFGVPSIQPTLKYCKSRAFRHLTNKNQYLQPMDHLKSYNSGKRSVVTLGPRLVGLYKG